MKISVLGLGYVGAVNAACLAREGHDVIAVDPERAKVALVNAGQSPVVEQDLGDIVREQVTEGRLCATVDVEVAVRSSDILIICAATPSRASGEVDLTHVKRYCEQVGNALKTHPGAPVVVVRSTMLPGTMRSLVIPTLEGYSRKRAGTDFGVVYNPENLREGNAVHDFYQPPKMVIGELNKASGDRAVALHSTHQGPLIRTDIESAEMVHFVDNAWHAAKVAFANEVGVLCKSLSVDAHNVLGIFALDTKLNMSPAYLKPGFAFGGASLPKSLRALMHRARSLGLELPFLGSILPSNALQIDRGMRAVTERGERRVGILGLTVKAGTDNLRESPMVELTERLIAKGYDVRVYDRNVSLQSLYGANREYILYHIPTFDRIVSANVQDVLAHASTIVIGNGDPDFMEVPHQLRDHQTVVDFMRICDSRSIAGVYEGICW